MNIVTKTTSQIIKLIALADIEPSDFQRPTNTAQVNRIVKRFDEAKLGTLTVSDRDSKYHIIDGAHRSRALRCLGYTHALCVVLTGLTYEEEAEYYRMQNQDKRGLSPSDLFKAGLASGNEQCVTINKIVKANGYHVGKGKNDFYCIAAFQTLFTIAVDYGYAVLDNTLFLLANTWAGLARASRSECLLGVAEFVRRYGLVDFAERLHDKFSLIWYEYSEAIRYHGSAGSAASRTKLCRILVDNYNKGIVHNSKKRLKWEEERQ